MLLPEQKLGRSIHTPDARYLMFTCKIPAVSEFESVTLPAQHPCRGRRSSEAPTLSAWLALTQMVLFHSDPRQG